MDLCYGKYRANDPDILDYLEVLMKTMLMLIEDVFLTL